MVEEQMSQSAFDRVMDAASTGVEAAMRAYLSGDIAAVRKHLDEVEAGVSLLRAWTDADHG